MLRIAIVLLVLVVCLAIAAPAGCVPANKGITVDAGFVSLTGKLMKDLYGSGGFDANIGFRVGDRAAGTQTISLGYFRTAGKTFAVPGGSADSWLSSLNVITTFRSKARTGSPYFGGGFGYWFMKENASSQSITVSGQTQSVMDAHALVGMPLTDTINLEFGYTFFIKQATNVMTGQSGNMGGAMKISVGGWF